MSDHKTATDELATKWNVRHQYSKQNASDAPAAANVLLNNQQYLPNAGTALDLACGRGANARLLNTAGLATYAWDISAVAIQELTECVPEIHAEVRDVVAQPPQQDVFDVIVVSRFLDRAICSAIEAALKPGGVLFYQTFTQGLSNPEFLLKPNELLRLFPSLHVQHYDEPVAGSEAALVACLDI